MGSRPAALGAGPGDIRAMIVGQALRTRCRAGVPGSSGWWAWVCWRGRRCSASLRWPLALGAGLGTLLLVVALAAYLPSRRATSVDPATTLRQ
jgi:hypothetical protein